MSWKVHNINRRLKRFDRSLFTYTNIEGKVLVMRKADRLEASDYHQEEMNLDEIRPQIIFALTHDWTVYGRSVDWGIEPILEKLRSMDSWASTAWISEMRKENERIKEDKKRMERNEFRATASDMRKEFAKATNDINTSTLEKIDRRYSHGNC